MGNWKIENSAHFAENKHYKTSIGAKRIKVFYIVLKFDYTSRSQAI